MLPSALEVCFKQLCKRSWKLTRTAWRILLHSSSLISKIFSSRAGTCALNPQLRRLQSGYLSVSKLASPGSRHSPQSCWVSA